MKRRMLLSGAMLGVAALCAPIAALAQGSCVLPAQKPMQVVHLFFGRAIPGRGPLTDREWSRFAADVLTPNFPDGFTAYDADGQWMNDKLHRIVRERSKVVIVAADSRADIAPRLTAVSNAYRKKFHQLSVGVISEMSCAAF
jgi:hypothetical protein